MQFFLSACFTAASVAAVAANRTPFPGALFISSAHAVVLSCKTLCVADVPAFAVTGVLKIRDPYHIIRNYKRRLRTKCRLLEKTIASGRPNGYTKELTTPEMEETKAGILNILAGIGAMKKSEVVYKAIYGGTPDTGRGITMLDTSTGTVLLRYPYGSDGKALIGHEIWHGIQYERGEISFRRADGQGGMLCDITDEREAYKMMQLSHINIKFTIGITDDSTRRISPAYLDFPPGPQDLHSPAGGVLRARIEEEGRQGIPNSEFYKGWEKDYEKGQALAKSTG